MRRWSGVVMLAGAVVMGHVGVSQAQTSREYLLSHGYRLPKQWGVSVAYYRQSQPYELDSLTLGIPGFDPALANNLSVDNTTTTPHAAFDYWLLPYLNVQVLAGSIDGETDVKLSTLNVGIPLGDIIIDYKGFFYGAGFTLAAGSERYFATITTEYTSSQLDNEDSSVSAWVFTPRIGASFGRDSAVYVGAMYQVPEESHSGIQPIAGIGNVPYEVTLTAKDRWNYVAGVNLGLTEHWVLTVEGGFGDRDAVLGMLTYRW
ncbi:MAG: hypothetical protein MUF10_15020 [Thermoanaerobaculaceae bacterium]|nr:hypothetical protein [Thermoanaerobaculaceae bacterium]